MAMEKRSATKVFVAMSAFRPSVAQSRESKAIQESVSPPHRPVQAIPLLATTSPTSTIA